MTNLLADRSLLAFKTVDRVLSGTQFDIVNMSAHAVRLIEWSFED